MCGPFSVTLLVISLSLSFRLSRFSYHAYDVTGLLPRLHSESGDILVLVGASWWYNPLHHWALVMDKLLDTKCQAKESEASHIRVPFLSSWVETGR